MAIIGQHINTPPVAPTWHNQECPRPLESLMLRLLSKDPSDRPESVADVLAALDAIDPSCVPEEARPTFDEAHALDSLADAQRHLYSKIVVLCCFHCLTFPVSRVIVWHTFICCRMTNREGLRIRLYGVDTPERGEPRFHEATERFRELAGNSVRIGYGPRQTDSYG